MLVKNLATTPLLTNRLALFLTVRNPSPLGTISPFLAGIECLKTYLARPRITMRDRLGRSTGIASPVSASVKTMTTSEPRESEAMAPSQQLCVSMCGGMPWPGSYRFTVHWSGRAER